MRLTGKQAIELADLERAEPLGLKASLEPEPSRTEELTRQFLDQPDSLTQSELLELAEAVLKPMLAKRCH